jgi:hypothetical protein
LAARRSGFRSLPERSRSGRSQGLDTCHRVLPHPGHWPTTTNSSADCASAWYDTGYHMRWLAILASTSLIVPAGVGHAQFTAPLSTVLRGCECQRRRFRLEQRRNACVLQIRAPVIVLKNSPGAIWPRRRPRDDLHNARRKGLSVMAGEKTCVDPSNCGFPNARSRRDA